MHRQHVARRQDEIEIAEDAFLDFAGVARAADQHQPLGEIDEDEGFRADAVELGDRMKLGRVEDGKGRLETGQLRVMRADEHVAGKKAVPRARRHHPHRQAVFRVGAGIEVLDEQLAALKIGQHALVQAGKLSRGDRLVDAAPIDRLVRTGFVDDVFVARAAAGVLAGLDDKGAAKTDLAFAPADGVLVEERHLQVPVHRPEMTHALRFEITGRLWARDPVFRLIQAFLHYRRARLPRPRWALDTEFAAHGKLRQSDRQATVATQLSGQIQPRYKAWASRAAAASAISAFRAACGSSTGAGKSSRAVSPTRRTSMPSR